MDQNYVPFRGDRPSWSIMAGKAKLLYNATRPSFTQEGEWTEPNSENSAPKIQCTFDGEPLSFDSDSCLSSEALNKREEVSGIVDSEVHNTYSYNLRSCARVKASSADGGAEHEFLFLAGPHDFYTPAATEFILYDVVGLQILLNYENHDFKATNSETYRIFALEGDGIMTDRNNIQTFQRSKFVGDAYAILHPKNAKGMNVKLHLPRAFDEVKNTVEYEAEPHSLECVVK